MALELDPHVLYEPEDNGILWIKINQPEKMNAVMPGMIESVLRYMRAADDDPNIRVMVVTGVGRGFCSGADMRGGNFTSGVQTEVGPRGPDASRQRFIYHTTPPYYGISQVVKPTIAMVNGPAMGMGMDLALNCDLRVGCENSRFYTYANLGQIIENGGMFWLPHICGIGRALELAYTGGFLGAQQAYEWGVLNKLVPADKLEEETRALCDKIIHGPPIVQWVSKRIMHRALTSTLEATLELCAHSSGILGASEDRNEARTAWWEKRTPVFKGL